MSSSLAKAIDLPLLAPAWRATSAATDQNDRAEGERRGAQGADPLAAVEEFVGKRAADANRDLIRLSQECDKVMGEANGKRERLRKELQEELPARSADNERRHQDEMGRLRREMGPDAQGFRTARSRLEDSEKELRTVRARVGDRPLRVRIVLLYIPLMLLLALAEVPVNRSAFELAFRDEPIFSLLLAFGVGLILIAFAHFVGHIVRQWPVAPSRAGVVGRVLVIAVLLALVAAAVFFLARMRQAYLALVNQENTGFAERLQEALRGGGAGAVDAIVALPPVAFGNSDWAFIMINVLIFTFGIAASFIRHDPDPDYEAAERRQRRQAKRFDRMQARFDGKSVAETRRFETLKQGLDAQTSALAAAVNTLADQERMTRQHLAHSRNLAAATLQARVANFCGAFNQAREKLGDGRLARPPSLPEIGRLLMADGPGTDG